MIKIMIIVSDDASGRMHTEIVEFNTKSDAREAISSVRSFDENNRYLRVSVIPLFAE